MVKNEEDIIELFIRKNLTVLDHMYISDNMSNDNTRSILNSLIAEGLPITVWDDLDPRHIQSEKTTAAYKKISENDKFDAIFFIDADEFLIGDRLKLEEYKNPGAVYALERVDYVISEINTTDIDFFSSMQYRKKKKTTSKSMIFHDAYDYEKIVIGEGNHYIHVNNITRKSVLNKNKNFLNLKIVHFPIRSKEQFIRKHLIGWLGIKQRKEKADYVGGHWKRAYEFLMKKNCNLSDKDFYQYLYKVDSFDKLKENVIYDPIKLDSELRYTEILSEKSTLILLAKAYEKSIEFNWKKNIELTDKLKKYSEDADILREASIYYEKINDIQTAQKIMNDALELRPNGPLIKAKVHEYRKKDISKSFSNFVMIVTYQRSGSTLLQSILNTSDDCIIRGENMNVLFSLYRSYRALNDAMKYGYNSKNMDWPFFGIMETRPKNFFYNSVSNFIDNVLNIKENVKTIGFKEVKYDQFGNDLPDFLDLMKECIPNLKIVFNYRNLDDVTISAWNKNRDQNKLKDSLSKFEDLCNNYHRSNNDWTIVIKYDEYLKDNSKLIPLFRFLDCIVDLEKVKLVLDKKLLHGK